MEPPRELSPPTVLEPLKEPDPPGELDPPTALDPPAELEPPTEFEPPVPGPTHMVLEPSAEDRQFKPEEQALEAVQGQPSHPSGQFVVTPPPDTFPPIELEPPVVVVDELPPDSTEVFVFLEVEPHAEESRAKSNKCCKELIVLLM